MHQLYINGADEGEIGDIPITSYDDNFAWRVLNITNQDITLVDGNTTDTPGTGALYVGLMKGAETDSLNDEIDNIFGDTTDLLNIYFDPDLAGNAYLFLGGGGDGIWDFASGMGQLMPYHTPLPPSVLLLGSGLLGLGLLGWRRKRG